MAFFTLKEEQTMTLRTFLGRKDVLQLPLTGLGERLVKRHRCRPLALTGNLELFVKVMKNQIGPLECGRKKRFIKSCYKFVCLFVFYKSFLLALYRTDM